MVKYTDCNSFYICTYPHKRLCKNIDQISIVITFSIGVMEDLLAHEKQN